MNIIANQTQTRTFKRKKNGTETQIQLILTKEPPIRVILKNFYMTAILKIITWNTAYSLFPFITFIERNTVILDASAYSPADGIAKYTNRGWNVVDIDTMEEQLHSLTVPQYVGDCKTWKICFDTTAFNQVTGPPDLVIENARFDVKVHQCLVHRSNYVICALLFRICVLKYAYTSSGHRDAHNFWFVFLKKRLDELAQTERRFLQTRSLQHIPPTTCLVVSGMQSDTTRNYLDCCTPRHSNLRKFSTYFHTPL